MLLIGSFIVRVFARMNSRLRIAIVVDFLPSPAHPHRGWVNYQRVKALSKFADVRAYRLEPAYPKLVQSSFQNGSESASNVVVVRYPAVPVLTRAVNGRFGGRVLAPRLREFRPDVVLAYFVYPVGFAAVMAGKRLGVPTVIGAVGSDLRRMNGVFSKPLATKALQSAAFVTTVNEELKRRAIARGLLPDKCRAVRNGCDSEIFYLRDRNAAKAELQIHPSTELVVFVGKLLSFKGIGELLEATAALTKMRPNLLLACVGEGSQEPKLRRRASQPDVFGHVQFVGGAVPREVARWMAAANVFCLPSHSEGTPNVVIEALSCGRPVVATNVGGIPEIVNPTCGILVPPEAPQRLTDALSEALDRRWDEQQIAAAFRRSWDDWARETYQVCCAVARKTVAVG